MRRIILNVLILLLLAVSAGAQTADELWRSLMDGNRTFVAGHIAFDNLADVRQRSAGHQNPPVTVLSCADSRVPPELIFNRSIDQLFVLRVAGNIAGPFDIASIEFAISNEYTKLIVVMGHEACGAVKAAMSPSDPPTPSLTALVQRIRESFVGMPPASSSDAAAVRKAIEANARASAAYLIAHSAVIREAVQSGKVGVVVAYYNLATGAVERIQ